MHYQLKQEVRQSVINEIGSQYPDSGLFDKHFNDAVTQVDDSGNTDIVDEVIKIMQQLLKDYANSEAKSKGGRIGRFFAKIFIKPKKK